jgi:hypothetical protein
VGFNVRLDVRTWIQLEAAKASAITHRANLTVCERRPERAAARAACLRLHDRHGWRVASQTFAPPSQQLPYPLSGWLKFRRLFAHCYCFGALKCERVPCAALSPRRRRSPAHSVLTISSSMRRCHFSQQTPAETIRINKFCLFKIRYSLLLLTRRQPRLARV